MNKNHREAVDNKFNLCVCAAQSTISLSVCVCVCVCVRDVCWLVCIN